MTCTIYYGKGRLHKKLKVQCHIVYDKVLGITKGHMSGRDKPQTCSLSNVPFSKMASVYLWLLSCKP